MNTNKTYENLTFKLIQMLAYKVLKETMLLDESGQMDDKSRYEHFVWVKKFVKLQFALKYTE